MPLLAGFLVVLLLTGIKDPVTAFRASSRRSDDTSLQSLETLVQQQAAILQKQEANLQALQNQVSILESSNSQALQNVNGDISRLKHSISNNSAALEAVNVRLNTQVFFTAHMRASSVSMGQESPLKFEDVVTNIGGGYNPHTGVFSAPVAGVYVFYAQLMKLSDTPVIHWVIDGSGSVLCKTSNDVPIYDKASCLATARVQKGEQVFVRRVMDGTPGSTLQGGWYCSFTGYLTSVDE